MFEQLCVRNYYELHGSLHGIETMSYYPVLLKSSKEKSVDITEYLYSLLGYKDDPVMSSYARYTYSKMFSTGTTKELQSTFNCKSTELANMLDKNDCLSHRFIPKSLDIEGIEIPVTNFKTYLNDEYFSSMIKLYSYYLRTSRSNYITSPNGNKVYFGELLMHIANLPSYEEMQEFINSPLFQKAFNITVLTIRQTNISEPIISKTTMFVPQKQGLTKHKSNIKELALYNALLGLMVFPLPLRETIKAILMEGYLSYITSFSKFSTLIDVAHMSGVTIKDIKDAMFVPTYDFNEHYGDFRGIAIPHSNNSVAIYNSTSGNESLILTDAQFKALYEKGLLKTLVFKKGVANVYINKDVPVYSLFGLKSGNDMRGV